MGLKDMNRNFLVNDLLRKVMDGGKYFHPHNNFLSPGYPAWNLLYYIFACVYKPNVENVIVETGTCNGLSTIIMAQAIKDFEYKGRIFTMELNPDNAAQATANIEEAGLSSYIQVILGDSKASLQKLLPTLPRLDFAFLDGDHTAPAVVAEFNLVKDIIKQSNGYVYFDNTLEGGVYHALQQIKAENPTGNLVMFPNCSWAPPGQAIWSF